VPARHAYRIPAEIPPPDPEPSRWAVFWRRVRRRLRLGWWHFWAGRLRQAVSACCQAPLGYTRRSHMAFEAPSGTCPKCKGHYRLG
jgi:hypothetical protein